MPAQWALSATHIPRAPHTEGGTGSSSRIRLLCQKSFENTQHGVVIYFDHGINNLGGCFAVMPSTATPVNWCETDQGIKFRRPGACMSAFLLLFTRDFHTFVT